ncbi:protein of unknown function [Jannaschia seohaensis]|uniref:Uncharacterized protein DUF1963 n=2 Tax=Jannaschia seohaensis TaxID=475081 RepID=A0A2Y9AQS8_9RHOB|nr:uncharacterized protein DUF1963 [Jannaschia seohaensis]SSA45688.1 protein of unknown function [Jannaschia seohaensis]
MFGPSANVQGAAEENQSRHLLLQLTSDDMPGFLWGDVGVLQFWIDHADLEARNWGAAEMTMEGF